MIWIETSGKRLSGRSGVSAERRKLLETEACGFLPKAATLVSQWSYIVDRKSFLSDSE